MLSHARIAVALLICTAVPLSATLVTEGFDASSMPDGWSLTTNAGYSALFPGGEVSFGRSGEAGSGFARLTYTSPVSGDFIAAAVIEPDFLLVNGGIMALVGYVGGEFFDAYLRNSLGSIQISAYNSDMSDNPWATWSSAGVSTLIILRDGNTIQAGVMGELAAPGGVVDLSGFVPLGSWTGDQYLGNLTLQLSFGHDGGDGGAEHASLDLFALATPPYDEVTPPGGTPVPEPVTASLAAVGLSALLVARRRRRG
jgi:hypothetical protein